MSEGNERFWMDDVRFHDKKAVAEQRVQEGHSRRKCGNFPGAKRSYASALRILPVLRSAWAALDATTRHRENSCLHKVALLGREDPLCQANVEAMISLCVESGKRRGVSDETENIRDIIFGILDFFGHTDASFLIPLRNFALRVGEYVIAGHAENVLFLLDKEKLFRYLLGVGFLHEKRTGFLRHCFGVLEFYRDGSLQGTDRMISLKTLDIAIAMDDADRVSRLFLEVVSANILRIGQIKSRVGILIQKRLFEAARPVIDRLLRLHPRDADLLRYSFCIGIKTKCQRRCREALNKLGGVLSKRQMRALQCEYRGLLVELERGSSRSA